MKKQGGEWGHNGTHTKSPALTIGMKTVARDKMVISAAAIAIELLLLAAVAKSTDALK